MSETNLPPSYNIAAIPTTYAGVNFRSRHEARYAAFFDLMDWKWEYEPIDLQGWTPDFRVGLPCYHKDCCEDRPRPFYHNLLVEVKPYRSIDEFSGTPEYALAMREWMVDWSPSMSDDIVALFGHSPDVSRWELHHGPWGGIYDIPCWVECDDWKSAWKKAGNIVQWRRPE